MTEEPALVESFMKGEDIHTRTASEVFDVRMESVTPELRRRSGRGRKSCDRRPAQRCWHVRHVLHSRRPGG
ncbi:MAG: DNA polymerase [Qipengyuania vulgaris]